MQQIVAITLAMILLTGCDLLRVKPQSAITSLVNSHVAPEETENENEH